LAERIKRVEGVDLNRVAQLHAQHLIKLRDELRAREGREGHVYEQSDTIYVLERKLDDQPTYEWEPVSMPFGLPVVRVQASLEDAIRNKEPIDSLLRRRLRRVYRELLLAAQILPTDVALARVLRLQVVVQDAPRILTL